MATGIALDILAVLLACGLLAHALRRRSPRSLPYPPGPPGLPLIGNALNIPKEQPWRIFANWSQQYNSPLVHMSVFGQHIVIVNDADTALDLFEKRSSIYSDRPRQVMLGELVGLDGLNFAFMRYGEHWRTSRKIFHRYFHPDASKSYRGKETEVAHDMLRRLLKSPDDLFKHLRYIPGKLILSIAYGIDPEPKDDPYITMMEASNRAIIETTGAGVYLVDSIPWLKYIPDFCAQFKRQAKEWAKVTEAAYLTPLQKVKDAVANPDPSNATNVQSVAGNALNAIGENQNREFYESCIVALAGVMYSAGSDTTVAGMNWFILAMMLRPDIQTAAQKQIDEVVGQERLPEFADEEALPLITAICKETLRWSAVLPTAIPHRLTQDDVYEGYYIPKGTMVVGNSWAMLRDPATYGPDADVFNPYRFLDASGNLDENVKDPIQAFGFGRRMCPGRFMATDSMWIWMASVLSTFDIAKAVGPDGKEITPSVEATTGMVIAPAEVYKYSIMPRSQKAEALIRATADY